MSPTQIVMSIWRTKHNFLELFFIILKFETIEIHSKFTVALQFKLFFGILKLETIVIHSKVTVLYSGDLKSIYYIVNSESGL